MSSVKKSIETAESAQAAGAGTGEDAVREAQREHQCPQTIRYIYIRMPSYGKDLLFRY